MKKYIIIVAAIIAVSCTNAQKTEFKPEALQEQLIASNGESVAFADILKKHSGKTIVIELWASWCSDCIKAMPKLKDLQASNPEVAYIFVSLDKTDDKWKAGIEKHQLKGDHYFSPGGMKGNFGKAIDLDWIPRYIIIDKNGKIVIYRAIETDFEKINATLKTL